MWNANRWQGVGPAELSMGWPSCKQEGTFEGLGVQDATLNSAQPPVTLGLRRCPNSACKAAIFVVHHAGELMESFPAETVDFDATNIPAGVVRSFEEAIKCHANQCFVAGAIMVRKTL